MPATLSPLRYPGGKTKFYTYVKELIRCNDLGGQTYIEPFAGGAGLAIKLLLNNDVNRIVINDYDPAIYAFWFSILNHTDNFCALIEETAVTPTIWQRQREIYFKQDTNEPMKLGFATFFLNRTNISGIIKGGIIGGRLQDGEYRMDARYNKEKLIQRIRDIAERKDQIVLLNLDAKDLLSRNVLSRFYKVFINLDPPYVRKGAQLYKNSFVEEDHRELSQIVSRCRRKWIVTYDVCPLVAELYCHYRHSFLDVTYSAQGTQKAKEYIFFSDNMIIPDNIVLCANDATINI